MKVPNAVQIIAVCTTLNIVVYHLRQLFIDNVAYEFRDRLGNLYRQSRDKINAVKVSAEHLHNFSLTTSRLCFLPIFHRYFFFC